MKIQKLFRQAGRLLLSNRNRTGLRALQEIGYSMPCIRKALLDLNNVRLKDLADGVSIVTLSNVIRGVNNNKRAKEMIAQALNLNVKELF